MRLDQLLQTVEGSTAGDWHHMEVHSVYGWEHGQKYLEPRTHSKLRVYKPDIDISLVLDATVNDPFAEPWAQTFPDQHAVSVAVQLRYSGAVVYDWVFVVVDGGRYLLPMPNQGKGGGYEVPKARMPLARLFFQLYGLNGTYKDADAALGHASVAIV